MRAVLLFVISAAVSQAATSTWLATVSPIMNSSERRTYLGLEPEAQAKFRVEFWSNKQIAAEEYYKRLQYIDATYGSTKTASGANTDPGRVYLSLGAPNRVTQIPSSRIFVPLEIWYYDTVPSIGLTTELRVMFYQKNSLGLLKLYSPTLDTVRVLLIPQSSAAGMFGPNANITESTIRQNLTVGPIEDEVLSASVGVAAGVTATGNDEILSRITSPEVVLGQKPRTDVKSRLVTFRPRVEVVQTPSPFGGSQVDLRLETELRDDLSVQIEQGTVPVYESHLRLNFTQTKAVSYEHRVDLLPGAYTVLFSVDGQSYPYPLEVSVKGISPNLFRATREDTPGHGQGPFVFGDGQYQVSSNGEFALLPLSKPGAVNWSIRRGFEVVTRATVESDGLAKWKLPLGELPPGAYKLEASDSDGDFHLDLTVKANQELSPSRPVISYNANLAPALRYALVGHEWVLRGKWAEARQALQASLASGRTDAAEIELARTDAMEGRLDEARNRVRAVLATQPKSFEALSVLAYVEVQFQDYKVAGDLYRRALAVQDSPALRQALASLP